MGSNLNLPIDQSSLHPPADIPVATGAVLGDAAADGVHCAESWWDHSSD